MEIFLASLVTWSHCQADTMLVITSQEVWGKWWIGGMGSLGRGKELRWQDGGGAWSTVARPEAIV